MWRWSVPPSHRQASLVYISYKPFSNLWTKYRARDLRSSDNENSLKFMSLIVTRHGTSFNSVFNVTYGRSGNSSTFRVFHFSVYDKTISISLLPLQPWFVWSENLEKGFLWALPKRLIVLLHIIICFYVSVYEKRCALLSYGLIEQK